MGVQLNIKDAETVALAKSLADALGKTVTETVRLALQEKRNRRQEEKAEMVRTAMQIAREASELWPERTKGMTSKQIIDELYDENGLPA